jgi:hypothetical protein
MAGSSENSSDRANARLRANAALEISRDRALAVLARTAPSCVTEHEEDRCSIRLYVEMRAGRERTKI